MKIQQLSIFLENKPGHLDSICRTLADADMNIVTMSLADTKQFGILRLIIEDWAKAKDVLEKVGFVVNLTEVVAMEVEDKPGGLAEILDIFQNKEINIEYMYAFTFRRGNLAMLVFRFDKPDEAIKILRDSGKNVLSQVELFKNANSEK